MSTEKIFSSKSLDLNNFSEVAQRMGHNLKGGECIELVGDVGAGKTEFVRSLAKGAKSEDKVASPTFTISRIYRIPDSERAIHHFDFYRLKDPGIIADSISEVLHDDSSTVVIEWSEIVKHVLPEKRLTITITTDLESTRILTFEYPENLKYLMDGVKV